MAWETGSERDICVSDAGRVSCLWEPYCVDIKAEEKQPVIQSQCRHLIGWWGMGGSWDAPWELFSSEAKLPCFVLLHREFWMWWPLGSRCSFVQGSLLWVSTGPGAGQSYEAAPSVPRSWESECLGPEGGDFSVWQATTASTNSSCDGGHNF